MRYDTHVGSKTWLVDMYHEQLEKFKKVGLGNKTDNGVVVTETLIKVTERRLAEISVVYDAKLKPRPSFFKIYEDNIGEKLHENHIIGTTAKSSSKSNSNNRHGGGKS